MTQVETPIGRAGRHLRGLRSSASIRGAAYLYASTITTSVLGFFFWFLAAKLLAPTQVGTASAGLSAAQLIASMGLLGLGTLTIAELSIDRTRVRSLVSATSIVAGTASALVALAAALVLAHTSSDLKPTLGGIFPLVVFVVVAGTTAAGLVIDDACIGMLRGEIQLVRNTVFAAAKLLLLPAAVYAWHGGGEQIVVAWLAGTLISLVLAYRQIGRAAREDSWRPDFANLVEKRGLIWSHHFLNVAILAPRLVAPIVVAGLVSPAANAGFFTAAYITNFVTIIPSELSQALFALNPGDEVALTRETRLTMRLCVVVAVVSALLFGLGSHEILAVFRHSYVSAAPAMAILGLITLPSAVKAHYVAIARVRGRMTQAAFLATAAAVAEVVGVVVGAIAGGMTGTAWGLLAAYVVEAVLFAPTVLGVLRGPAVTDSSQPS
jgi:O-antigen/teichoic acid export membrane protein